MLHLMKYRFISLYKEKNAVFWSLLFPIILGTLFYASFGNINNSIDTISVAVVSEDSSDNAKAFRTFLDEVQKDESEVIQIQEMSKEEALEKLKSLDIYGIYYVKEQPELTVTSNGMEESILETLLKTYNQKVALYTSVAKDKPEKLSEIMSDTEMKSMVKEVTTSGKEIDGSLQYFLSLIAMACLFGCYIGFHVAVQLQANVSDVAVRRNVAPVNKLKQIAADTLVGCGIQFTNNIWGVLYLKYVLGINIGSDMPKLVLVCIVGSMIGVSMGMVVGSVGSWSEDVKGGILTGVSLICSFLAGLMISGVKGAIEKSMPILNRINPAALITDAIYSIDVYPDSQRYKLDMISMVVMVLVFSLAAFMMTRRKRYDSI